RSDVDDPPLAVEAGERLQRTAFVAILAVVVVLDDEGAASRGPVEELQPSRERQRDAGRELVRWRHVGEPRGWCAAASLRQTHPLIVDARRHQPGAGGFEHPARTEVMRLLDEHPI